MLIAEIEDSTKYWVYPQRPIPPVETTGFSLPVQEREPGPAGQREVRKRRGRVLCLRDCRHGERRRGGQGAAQQETVDVERRKADNRTPVKEKDSFQIVVLSINVDAGLNLNLMPGDEVLVEPVVALGSPQVTKQDAPEPLPPKIESPSPATGSPENPDYVVHLSQAPKDTP